MERNESYKFGECLAAGADADMDIDACDLEGCETGVWRRDEIEFCVWEVVGLASCVVLECGKNMSLLSATQVGF